jgi:large conductance mechanosensitive channel
MIGSLEGSFLCSSADPLTIRKIVGVGRIRRRVVTVGGVKGQFIKKFFAEFREFINKGNLVAIAIGFVMGSAFTGLVTALVENVIMPTVAIPFGKPNFDDVLILTINDAEIRFGAFLTVAMTFLSIAFVLFTILKIYNRATGDEAVAPPSEIGLLTEIRDELRAQRPTNG